LRGAGSALPDGRGTLLGVLRPKYGVDEERDEDMFGIVLCAVMVERFMLPSGGRGTDREAERVVPSDLAPALVEGAEDDLTLFCGRGTLRPAPDEDTAVDCRPSGARLAADGVLLRAGVEAAMFDDGLAELAGGVIRLTVGREAVAAEGCAAGKPAFEPRMLLRVGDTFGRPMLALDRLCKALDGMFALFPATDSPRSRVFRETAVSAPGLVA
jgi:hypothetical protein